MGMANTNQVYDRFTTAGAALTNSYPAGFAWEYTNNGKTDWHLPSKLELAALYTYRTQVGGFAKGTYWEYWSSSEMDIDRIYFYAFNGGYNNTTTKNENQPRYVRPVRAF
jgi:hypothetical protein